MGVRKIFSIHDAYLISYLDLLRRRGLQTDALKRIHDLLSGRFNGDQLGVLKHFSRDEIWLVISLTKMVVMTEGVIETAPGNWTTTPLQIHEIYDDVGIQVAVNIRTLMEKVDQRAYEVLARQGKLVHPHAQDEGRG